ncbi:metallophosphoesterase family protein [Blastococcus sp. VKM Ac-2987]|uniref:metallophosphoesterase family protein n=1 Tax=Blastococcus sp. VKM Ac-2987 TaxID=3004141 RepID=UPI0022AB683B|nr:metallophosphoesterase [Blastococcus sp. VKM Ac-2987]MCZ2859630.1 metallophosphoesterase [Blastococcus sp. VKM Ac-2987]
MPLTRRQFLAAAAGVGGAALTGGVLADQVWPLLSREDLVPGRTPELVLPRQAWTTTPDRLTFAAVGDTGTGGRQAVAVAARMAQGYEENPYGLITHLGDICYYGKIEDRFEDVFLRPYGPLIQAGVDVELAIGNHDGEVYFSDARLEEIETELRLLGTPARYYRSTHGPVDFFYLDSSMPGLFGDDASAQLDWLDDALTTSASQWKVVCLHHPPYSSGRHGATPGAEEALVPVLERHAVDLVLTGHDHNYERTVPLNGITYVVSGGGAKLTPVRPTRITAAAASVLQYLHVEVDGDRLTARCIRPDGGVVDRFTLRAREGR